MICYKDKAINIIFSIVNPQNYTAINFHESAQYSDSASKTFVVWWLKDQSAIPLINFIYVTFTNHSHLQKT